MERRRFLGGIAAIVGSLFARPTWFRRSESWNGEYGLALANAPTGQSIRVLAIEHADAHYAKIALLGDTVSNVCRECVAVDPITTGDLIEISSRNRAKPVVARWRRAYAGPPDALTWTYASKLQSKEGPTDPLFVSFAARGTRFE